MISPQIAIVDSNTLSSMGLESLLEEIIPEFTIRTFRSFEALTDDTPDAYAHYFVATQIYFEHTAFFLARPHKTIVLTSGSQPQLSGLLTLDVNQDGKALAKNILNLHRMGHKGGHPGKHPAGMMTACANGQHDLSSREIEVLQLVVRGFISKEIADRLNISLTTVISHRKNITEKLGIKSVAGLAVYAVMRGYIEVDMI
ncbi:MAG: helix-turn-helix transcriptional regulator [Prevotellaceae bacterium]|nr:helix-turn-helix transcriptional regulator [Prevotellaceae bacterium]